MMCQRIGRPPISTIGLGRNSVSSRNRVPNPPAKITAFIVLVPSTATVYHGNLSALSAPGAGATLSAASERPAASFFWKAVYRSRTSMSCGASVRARR